MPRAQPGQRFGGRAKGVSNKMTVAVKEVIAEAAERLGGVNRLVAWAKEDPLNERAFWTSIYPKLLPLTLAGDSKNPLIARVEHAIVQGALEEFDETTTIEYEDFTDSDYAGVPALIESR